MNLFEDEREGERKRKRKGKSEGDKGIKVLEIGCGSFCTLSINAVREGTRRQASLSLPRIVYTERDVALLQKAPQRTITCVLVERLSLQGTSSVP